MARYIFLCLALSPRDGGWVRLSNPRDGQSWFQSEEDAWLFIEAFWGLIVLHGDFISLDVRRTIRFRLGPAFDFMSSAGRPDIIQGTHV